MAGLIPDEICPICYQSIHIKVILPCQHIFCFGCLKGCLLQTSGQQTVTCPLCRKEISPDLRKTLLKQPECGPVVQFDPLAWKQQPVVWLYSGRQHSGWWIYDIEVSRELEVSYQRHDHQLTVVICGISRTIDLDQMIQLTPQFSSQRSIKRVTREDLPEFLRTNMIKGRSGYATTSGDSPVSDGHVPDGHMPDGHVPDGRVPHRQ